MKRSLAVATIISTMVVATSAVRAEENAFAAVYQPRGGTMDATVNAIVVPVGYSNADVYEDGQLLRSVSINNEQNNRLIVIRKNDQIYIGNGVVLVSKSDKYILVLRNNNESYMQSEDDKVKGAGWLSPKAIAGLFGMPDSGVTTPQEETVPTRKPKTVSQPVPKPSN